MLALALIGALATAQIDEVSLGDDGWIPTLSQTSTTPELRQALYAPLLSSTVPVIRPPGGTITTTRAGTAYDINASNLADSCAANTGCYNAAKGLKSFAASVQLATFSYAFDNAAWAKTNVTVTANTDSGPFSTLAGGAEADRVVSTAAAHAISQDITVSASTNYVLWFWAKNNGGTRALYSVRDLIGAADIIAATSYFSSINSSTFTLVALPFTTPVGCTSVRIYPIRDSVSGTDILFTGAHLALASGATSIPCPRADATALTCAADVHTVPTTGWPTTIGEISLRYTANSSAAPAGFNILVDSRTTSTTQGVVLYRDTSNRLVFNVYAGAQVCTTTSAALTWSSEKLIKARWTPTSCEILADGVSVANAVATGSPASHDSAANLGSNLNGAGSENVNGWERAVCAGRWGACP